jgi:SAM-dependent methyltransferase
MLHNLDSWQSVLVCPLDHTPLNDGCPTCGFRPAIEDGRPDFRALGQPQTVEMSFQIPVEPLDRYQLAQTHFHAINQQFDHYSRAEIRKQFGTKLDKGIQYYCQQLLRECGPDAPILDLGCGSGGNRRYLQSLGFRRVLTVDWSAKGADLLVDAHRLPLVSSSFQMVLSTAVFEHLYNPYLAMSEVGRVLQDGGYFVGGASFWEGWHGSSYFHMTPDGWNAVLQNAGLSFEDLWPGWGIIPAALTHVLTPGHFRGLGYGIQRMVYGLYRLTMGEAGLRRLQLRASGSYQVFARKSATGH